MCGGGKPVAERLLVMGGPSSMLRTSDMMRSFYYVACKGIEPKGGPYTGRFELQKKWDYYEGLKPLDRRMVSIPMDSIGQTSVGSEGWLLFEPSSKGYGGSAKSRRTGISGELKKDTSAITRTPSCGITGWMEHISTQPLALWHRPRGGTQRSSCSFSRKGQGWFVDKRQATGIGIDHLGKLGRPGSGYYRPTCKSKDKFEP